MSEYGKRSPIELDEKGGYFIKHMAAMTAEDLCGKAEIAEELGYRDMIIDTLTQQLTEARAENEKMVAEIEDTVSGMESVKHSREMYITDLLQLAGCRCKKPLIGFKPPMNFPRCGLCNTITEEIVQNIRAAVSKAMNK
jgi:hypothetical protein